MKKNAKQLIVNVLGWQVRRLRKRANFKVVAVAGSIGKTSTKFAVATVLEEKFKVRWQKGNYNDVVSVPLVFFGLPIPSLLNPFAWIWSFLKIELQLRRNYPYDVVVVEVGTDFPGNIALFKQYLHADLGVLTAITPEHMEFFADIDAVAKEELTIAELSDKLLINIDYCNTRHLKKLQEYLSYGVDKIADYRLEGMKNTPKGYNFTISKNGKQFLTESHSSIAKTQLFSITAAISVADMLGLTQDQIRSGITAVKPVSGRMQRLQGIKNSIILDDTYNASPEATRAALDTLYSIDAPQKIALLGNMNELGKYSEPAHKEVGAYCDPAKLDLVVTLGPDANKYLATEAEKTGCQVVRTDSPYESADVIKSSLRAGAVILAKGSQNKVFAEEAVRLLLDNPADSAKLVRQGRQWQKLKAKSFADSP